MIQVVQSRVFRTLPFGALSSMSLTDTCSGIFISGVFMLYIGASAGPVVSVAVGDLPCMMMVMGSRCCGYWQPIDVFPFPLPSCHPLLPGAFRLHHSQRSADHGRGPLHRLRSPWWSTCPHVCLRCGHGGGVRHWCALCVWIPLAPASARWVSTLLMHVRVFSDS